MGSFRLVPFVHQAQEQGFKVYILLLARWSQRGSAGVTLGLRCLTIYDSERINLTCETTCYLVDHT